jgi:DNA-binding NtrC family response regulator
VSGPRGCVLVVDDKPNLLGLLRQILSTAYEVETASDGAAALNVVATRAFDVVLTDVKMPGADGFEVVRAVKQRWPSTEVIMMTAYASIETAMEAVRLGAYDYLAKPFDPDDVSLVVARALERKRLRERADALPAAAAQTRGLGKLVGESPAMRDLFSRISHAAGLDVPVLLIGESGAGKELAAEAIHANSRRRDAPFVPVDCAAVLPDILDRDLVAGGGASLSGASVARGALWAQAEGGTLFLNEIDDLPPPVQLGLGRLLEAPAAQQPDVRVMAGTDQDLGAAVKAGRFREELLCRLNLITIAVPPLRVRGSDILLLAQSFLQRFAARRPELSGFEPEVLEALLAYDWPGNVRELRNLVERAAAAAQGKRIALRDLPFDLRRAADPEGEVDLSSLTYREALNRARDRASREYLIALMRTYGGRVTHAAAGARIERESLHRLLKRYKVRAEAYREDDGADER